MVRVLGSEILLDRRWLRVRAERLELPNGAIIDEFHLLESPDWAGVVALTARDELVLVEQYRHGLGRMSRELPAGLIDPGETPLDAARRELLEETGCIAARWTPLAVVSPEPSRSTHRAHLFLATGVEATGNPCPEPTEVLRVIRTPAAEVLAQLGSGYIEHAAHVAAVLLAARRGWGRASQRPPG